MLPQATVATVYGGAADAVKAFRAGFQQGKAETPAHRPTIRVEYPSEGDRKFAVAPEAAADTGWTDSRIMMQLGMLLGIVYAAFLTVWFWATRIRPQPYGRA
jgi:hypothetical protein